jgi:dTDP-4-amino-4,6-dideoxygalactose transaminase
MTGKELWYISQAHANGHLAGDGVFTRQCNSWLESYIGCNQALLTHSCTGALEIAAILANLQPGDEVIMPSYTFVSTANAFVLRGAVPVFVDIRADTLNIDDKLIEASITEKTRAIVVVHYAGVACEMDTIMDIARRHELLVIEDNAQGLGSSYKNRPLGSIGDLAAISFHETKNIISGEGGALLVNSSRFGERAEMIREKGTNRSQFFRGEVAKYTWMDIGSSYLPSDLIAAFLWAQMEEADAINQRRLNIWNTYHQWFASLEEQGKARRPVIPQECKHNAHMYYLLLPTLEKRSAFIHNLKEQGIDTVFHYVPLHDSPVGQKCGRVSGELKNTTSLSERLVRLPLWLGLEQQQAGVIEQVIKAIG